MHEKVSVINVTKVLVHVAYLEIASFLKTLTSIKDALGEYHYPQDMMFPFIIIECCQTQNVILENGEKG